MVHLTKKENFCNEKVPPFIAATTRSNGRSI